MKITFLGVGEACDPLLPNTSMVVESSAGNLLLDCGFTTPHTYFKQWPHADFLDLVWISHFHGDHFFGMPLLFLELWLKGRQKELLIAGPRGVEEKVLTCLDLAYPTFASRLQFPLVFLELEPGQIFERGELRLQSAANEHSVASLSLSCQVAGKKVVYSGDGRPTIQSRQLAEQADLLVQEAFWFDSEAKGHGNVLASLALADQAQVRQLALVHISAEIRHNQELFKQIEELARQAALPVHLPLPGEEILCQ